MPHLLERLKSALASSYAVESEIGRGGMATVYLAEDLKHHRKVAIKVLHPELAASLGTDRFLREIEIAAKLEHPHILALIDSGGADGLPYYVMPYVEGESLRERLEREGQLPIDRALSIAVEVADGLDYAHRQGVIHRDIKPGNNLLSAKTARFADFGGARAIDEASGFPGPGWRCTAREWVDFWRRFPKGQIARRGATTATLLAAAATTVSSPRATARSLSDPTRLVRAVVGESPEGAWVVGTRAVAGRPPWAFALFVRGASAPLAVARADHLLVETIRTWEHSSSTRNKMPPPPLDLRER